MDMPLDKRSNKKLVQDYTFNSETLKLFDEAYWGGAFTASSEITQRYTALQEEAFTLQQHLQVELANRTLARIRTRLNLLLEGLAHDESENKEEGAP